LDEIEDKLIVEFTEKKNAGKDNVEKVQQEFTKIYPI